MRLINKLNQLVVGASGKPRIFDVTRVNLRKDGTVTGKISTGERVKCDKLEVNAIWRPF
jgi:hypothetical protein